jgi:DNA polymerase-3 subunit gamma/tau
MSQALYRKWRPARFDQVIGQEHVTRTLQNSLSAGRVGHAYLFCGPRGTGKTTMARLLAKAVNCENEAVDERPDDSCPTCLAISQGRFLDLLEIDAASNTGVDDMRNLRDKINFAPSQGRFKVYIIDEVHMLSTAAFNALLKTLEEPPAHTIFVLATTEEHKVPLTIKSRCQQFNFRLLTIGEITERLAFLAAQESLTVEPAAVELIARQAAGSLRDAESLLDQLVISPGDTITLERAQLVLGTAPDAAVAGLTDAWLDGDSAAGLRILHDALISGADARQFARQMVAYLRQLLLLQAAGAALTVDGPTERKGQMTSQAQRAPRRALIDAVRRFHEASQQSSGSWQPQLPLELAFLELVSDIAGIPVSAPLPAAAATAVRQPVSAPASTAAAPEELLTKPAARSQKATPPATSPAVESPQTAPPPPSGGTLTLPAVTGHWHDMVMTVGQQIKNLPPLLAMCKPLAVEHETIILGFDYPIFKEKFDKMPGAANAVIDAFRSLSGTNCTIRGVVTSEYAVPIRRQDFHDLANELGGIVREE